jgi:hypothetical protein
MFKTIRRTLKKAYKKTLNENTIWINYKNPAGYIERIPTFEGDNLYEVMKNYKTEIGGLCGGGSEYPLTDKPVQPNADYPFCMLCAIEVEDPWYSKMDIHRFEKNILDLNPLHLPFDVKKRFACCIKIEKWMNEMVVSIPYDMKED